MTLRVPEKPREVADWKDFCNKFMHTVRGEDAGYLVRQEVSSFGQYMKTSNPHCHTSCALMVKESDVKDMRVVLVLSLPAPLKFQVVHSIVLSASLTSILSDTYKGELREGTYYYGKSHLHIAAAWRFGDVLRASYRKGDGATLLPKLQIITKALEASAR